MKIPLLGSPKASIKKDRQSPCSLTKKLPRLNCDIILGTEDKLQYSDRIKKESNHSSNNLFIHEHGDHLHAHEHDHGGKGNIIITTIGLVIHSLADGSALGASLYCKLLKSY